MTDHVFDSRWPDMNIQPDGHRILDTTHMDGGDDGREFFASLCQCGTIFKGYGGLGLGHITLQYRDHKEEIPHIEYAVGVGR